MKKVLAILLAGMMTATAFAGCGGGSTASKAEGGSDTASKSDDGGATIDPSWPDASLFGDEDNITLKVWAPDKAVALVQKQVEAFKSHYSDKKFTSIEVVAQGENDAATLIVNDPEKAADVFGFPSDQLNKLKDAQVLTPVAPALLDSVKTMNAEKTVTAATFDDQLYAFPETNDNGYYLVFDNSVVTEEDAKTLEGILEAWFSRLVRQQARPSLWTQATATTAACSRSPAARLSTALRLTAPPRSSLSTTRTRLLTP